MPHVRMPEKGADFELPPAGAHIAVCYRVIDLGTQETTFKGQKKHTHQILISWELPDEPMRDGRPFSVHKRYTYSSNEKANLRKDLESWRGKKFEDAEFGTWDIGTIISAGCMINIVHDDKGDKVYANIASIMRLPKGTKATPPANATVVFSLDPEEFDSGIFEKLGDNLCSQIAKSPEYAKATGNVSLRRDDPPLPSEDGYGATDDSDIPF